MANWSSIRIYRNTIPPLPKNNSHQNHFDTIILGGLFSAEKYLASFSVPLHSMMQFGGLYFLQ